jgi:hypothetical protein
MFRKPCYNEDQQPSLLPRTGADGLFILPQGHALQNAGSHVKKKPQTAWAKTPETTSAEPAKPPGRTRASVRQGLDTQALPAQHLETGPTAKPRGAAGHTTCRRSRPPGLATEQATQASPSQRQDPRILQRPRPGGHRGPLCDSHAGAETGGGKRADSSGGAPRPPPLTQSHPRGRHRRRGDVREAVKHDAVGPTHSPETDARPGQNPNPVGGGSPSEANEAPSSNMPAMQHSTSGYWSS